MLFTGVGIYLAYSGIYLLQNHLASVFFGAKAALMVHFLSCHQKMSWK